MIAEALPGILRNADRRSKHERCVREPDFTALYRALGDKERQNAIRNRNPQTRHCRWLMGDPMACDQFPEAIGETGVGEPCPNNPYAAEPQLYQQDQYEELLISEAAHLGALLDLRILPGEDRLEPAEFEILRQLQNFRRAQERDAIDEANSIHNPSG